MLSTTFLRKLVAPGYLIGQAFYITPYVWDAERSEPAISKDKRHNFYCSLSAAFGLVTNAFLLYQLLSALRDRNSSFVTVSMLGHGLILMIVTSCFELRMNYESAYIPEFYQQYVKLAEYLEETYQKGDGTVRLNDTLGQFILASVIPSCFVLGGLFVWNVSDPGFPIFYSSLPALARLNSSFITVTSALATCYAVLRILVITCTPALTAAPCLDLYSGILPELV